MHQTTTTEGDNMPRAAGSSESRHKAYAAFLTETTGTKITPNTVASVLSNQGAFRDSEYYVEHQNSVAQNKAAKDEAKLEARREALRVKLAELGDNSVTPARKAPAKKAAAKAAAKPSNVRPIKSAPTAKVTPRKVTPTDARGAVNDAEADAFDDPDDF